MCMRNKRHCNVLFLHVLVVASVLHLTSGQTNQIASLPWSCDFTDSLCGFELAKTDYQWFRHEGQTKSRFTGPDGDHTGELNKALPTSKRFYIFAEATDVDNGMSSWLRSPRLPTVSEDSCLEFYLSVYGMHIGSLLVTVEYAGGNSETVFMYTGDWEENRETKYKAWLNEEVTIPRNAIYFYFVAIRGGTAIGEPYGDIGLDDIQLQPGPCTITAPAQIQAPDTSWPTQSVPLPVYSRPDSSNCDIVKILQECNFDISPPALTAACQVLNDQSDDLIWYHNSGPTKTAKTGPSQDNTQGTANGHYVYMEASLGSPNQVARLMSPDLTTFSGPFCLSFMYHMYGLDIGSLKVLAHFSSGQEQELFGRAGDQGFGWLSASDITVPEGTMKVVIQATRGGGEAGDIAIDDFLLRYPGCDTIRNCAFPPQTPATIPPAPVGSLGTSLLNCPFDSNNCNFETEGDGDFLWHRLFGPTPTALTGPSVDHTLGTDQGFYMYTEASDGEANQRARLLSPQLTNPGNVAKFCLSFWHYDYGRDLGIIKVIVRMRNGRDFPMFMRDFINDVDVRQDPQVWRQELITLPGGTWRIIFEHTRGPFHMKTNPYGDFAIDDIAVTTGECQQTGDVNPITTPSLVQWVGENQTVTPAPTDVNTGFQPCEQSGAILAQCDFESGTCGFQAGTGWQVDSGFIVAYGPDRDHTLGTSSGHYLYISMPAQSGGSFIRSEVTSPALSPGAGDAYAVQFWLYIGGQGVDSSITLISLPSGAADWARYGIQGSGWQLFSVTLTAGTRQIRFEVTSPSTGEVVYAIDDVILREKCAEGDLGGYENEPPEINGPAQLDVSDCSDPTQCGSGFRCFASSQYYFCIPEGKCKKKKR